VHGARIRQAADRLHVELEARLGAEQAQRVWTRGERLSLDEAVSLALDEGRRTTARDTVLSARELEVAQLVAQGLTSAQIANLLHLSPRTVDNHLARIFNKLGLSSRLQLATWLMAGNAHIERL
jgi:DNA-binding CsgD family transcriptional regulator